MTEKYFDTWQFKSVVDTINKNPIKAKQEFEEYIKQYPKDYAAYPYYASSLITLGEFDKAYKILEYVERQFNFFFATNVQRCIIALIILKIPFNFISVIGNIMHMFWNVVSLGERKPLLGSSRL